MASRALRLTVIAAIVAAPLAAGRPASATTTLSPPYEDATRDEECWAGAGTCSVAATAVADGDVDLSMEVASPSGGTSDPPWAWAVGWVHSGFELTVPAAAVDIELRVHVDHAEGGHTGGTPTDWGYAAAWVTLEVEAPSCSDCVGTWNSQDLFFLFDGEWASIDDEEYTARVRLQSRSGDVPAGPLTLHGGVGATVSPGGGDGEAMVAAVDATVTGIEVSPIVVSQTGSESRAYVGAGGDVAQISAGDGILNERCVGPRPGIGGTCFPVDAGDQLVEAVVTDDHTADPIAGQIQFRAESGTLLEARNFCGSTGRLWLPEETHHVVVFTQSAQSVLRCEAPALATTGEVTLTRFG